MTLMVIQNLGSIEETLSKFKFVEDITTGIRGPTGTFLFFNIQYGLALVAVIVDILYELLSFSLEVPVQGKYGTVETLLQQAVHVSGLVRLAADLHVEQSQHDDDQEDDDSSQGHDHQQSNFIIGVEILGKKCFDVIKDSNETKILFGYCHCHNNLVKI